MALSNKLYSLWQPRWGRLLGALAGALLGGGWGAVAGFCLGLLFDYLRPLWPFFDRRWPAEDKELSERRFLIVSFALMGHLAKIDGRVSEYEVAMARAIMNEQGLDETDRRRAIDLFTAGKGPGFPLRRLTARLRRSCSLEQRERSLAFLVRLALADGRLKPPEYQLLLRVCSGLGLDRLRLEQLLRRRRDSHEQRSSPRSLRRTLQSAYKLLGIDEAASDAEVKRAYRRSISRNHPDRMVARGLSEAEVQAAARRTHAVRSAFEQIRRARNM